LRPGEYVDVHDTISIAAISEMAGNCEVRVVYAAPKYSAAEKQELKAGMIETPKGQYESEPVRFVVP